MKEIVRYDPVLGRKLLVLREEGWSWRQLAEAHGLTIMRVQAVLKSARLVRERGTETTLTPSECGRRSKKNSPWGKFIIKSQTPVDPVTGRFIAKR